MSAGVLVEAQIARDNRRVDRRELRRAEIALAEQPVDGARAHAARKLPLGSTHASLTGTVPSSLRGPGPLPALRKTGRGAQSAIS